MKQCLITILFIFNSSTACYAIDLIDVYQQALENDTFFKQAYSTYMASTEAIPQALSALYPQINAGAALSNNYLEVIGDTFDIKQGYNQQQLAIKATQAVFNYQLWFQLKQAKASVKASQAEFNDAAQDLMLRTAQAYFSVLLAQDTLQF